MSIHRILPTIVLLLLSGIAMGQQSISPPNGPPPNAEEGKCYAICVIPNQYETYTETVETQAASTRTIVQMPEYETVQVRVMTQPASVRNVYIPAEYETVTERVEVKAASVRYEVIPAKFEEREERIMIQEGSTEYRTLPASFETVTNSTLYYGGEGFGVSQDYGNLLDPDNPNNPNRPDSPFNPSNPESPFNPENSNSPFNPLSPYSFDNPDNVLNANPAADQGTSSRSLNTNEEGVLSNPALTQAGTGTILPYIVREASVKLDRIPREYETISEEVEIKPAGTAVVTQAVPCSDENKTSCMSYCLVEVPAEYQTVTRRVAKACAVGYVPGTTQTGGDDYCVRLTYVPAAYGPRSIMTAGPQVEARSIEPRYTTVKKMVKVQDAQVKEIPVAAEFREVERTVVKRAAYVREEIVPAKYETVTRRVRKGLADVDYFDPTGTLILPSEFGATGTRSLEKFPSTVNPATGYSLPNAPVHGELGPGTPRSGMLAPGDPGSLNTGDVPGGLPDNYYTAGCPNGFRFDPMDNTCKQTIEVAAQTQTVTKQRLVKAGGFSEWTEVLCPTQVDAYTIRQVQKALEEAGYDPGPIDNIMGTKTKAALRQYQLDRGIPLGGLNLPTLRTLGLQ